MTVLSALFSFRGRITRAEHWIGTLAWLLVLAASGLVARAALGLGYLAAVWTYVGFVLAAAVSLQAMGARRAHDLGYTAWSLFRPFRSFAVLFRRGTAGPNAYGPPPRAARKWWLLGSVATVGIVAYASAAFAIDRFAAAYCTPYVSASAPTKDAAEQLWKQAVTSVHGALYVTGVTVGQSNVCRLGECVAKARACRRP